MAEIFQSIFALVGLSNLREIDEELEECEFRVVVERLIALMRGEDGGEYISTQMSDSE